MNYWGIDPGFTGAIARISDTGAVTTWSMPTQWVGKKAYKGYDLVFLTAILAQMNVDDVLALENPTTRPGEGAEQCFRFGKGIGNVEGILAGLGHTCVLVSPMKWMGAFELPAKEKDPGLHLRIATMLYLYPNTKPLWTGPRGGILDGILEAILIGHWIKLTDNGL
jgi:hypothetical protein